MPRTTSSASAQPGTRRGLTKEATWMRVSPVSLRASISSILRAVGMGPGSIWKPSRGPSSAMVTRFGRSVMAGLLAVPWCGRAGWRGGALRGGPATAPG